jgi:hypothetical protein
MIQALISFIVIVCLDLLKGMSLASWMSRERCYYPDCEYVAVIYAGRWRVENSAASVEIQTDTSDPSQRLKIFPEPRPVDSVTSKAALLNQLWHRECSSY